MTDWSFRSTCIFSCVTSASSSGALLLSMSLATYVTATFIRQEIFRNLQTLIIIGDVGLAKELFEKRGAKYSSRPPNHFFVRTIPRCLAIPSDY